MTPLLLGCRSRSAARKDPEEPPTSMKRLKRRHGKSVSMACTPAHTSDGYIGSVYMSCRVKLGVGVRPCHALQNGTLPKLSALAMAPENRRSTSGCACVSMAGNFFLSLTLVHYLHAR